MDRKLYETPLLYENFKRAVVEIINHSNLMMCEIEPIIREIYSQVRAESQVELENAYKMQRRESELQEKESQDELQETQENTKK